MAEVFISYRHDDSEGWAGRLAEAIQIAFGETEVFFDMESIIPSAEWRRSIEEALTSCKVLIALIGPRWVSAAAPAGQRRLDNPQDVVRYEIASALHHGIPLLPVLVGGATLPQSAELPKELQGVLAYQALELPTRRWKRDIELVLAAVEKALGRPQVNSTSIAAVKVGENLEIEDVQAGDLAGIKGNKVPSGMRGVILS